MAKNPYLKFYIGDYIKDTKRLPLNIRGGWVELILAMWDNDPKGEITGDMEEFSRVMSCSLEEAILVIQTLKQKKICDFSDLGDGRVRLVSRKQKSMIKLSQTRSEVGKNGGNPNLVKQKDNQKVKQKDKLNCEYEYESTIVLKEGGVGGKNGWRQMPGEEAHGLEIPSIKAGSAMELMHLNGNKASMDQVLSLWNVFKVQNLTGKKFYASPDDVYSHFINWSKDKKVNGTHQQQFVKRDKSSGARQAIQLLKDDITSDGIRKENS